MICDSSARQIASACCAICAPGWPRRMTRGKALTGDLKGLWRYRIGDIRMIASIKDETVTVLVLRVAHRREIYG
jgi:mRNA-degrading endonuclease RelE of RelBE toxin-antitoxin system